MPDLKALLSVLLIGFGCALTLAVANWLSADRIRANETSALRAELTALAGAADALPRPLPDLDQAPPASWIFCDGTLFGYSETTGYGGPMVLLLTLRHEPAAGPYRLGGLRLLRHAETPGITDFLRDPDGWLTTFQGRSADGIEAVAAISGATITSRALKSHLAGVLNDPAGTLGEPQPASCGR